MKGIIIKDSLGEEVVRQKEKVKKGVEDAKK